MTHSIKKALRNEEFTILLEGIENNILETGALTDVIPFDFIDISLLPEAYVDTKDDESRIKITVDIGTEEDFSDISEDECETISDTVRDILSEKGLFQCLETLGVESADEIVDWMPVSFNGDYPF